MNNPKLRFRDDSGSRFVDWQKVSFGKTFSFLKSSAFSRAQLNYRDGQIKNVHYGDILVKFPTILNSCCNDVPYVNPAEKTEKYDLLQVGDIVIADTAEDLTVGKAIEISDVSNSIIAGLHTIACRPQRKFANRFLGYYLNSKAFHNQLVPLATGIKVYSIIKSEIVKTRINVPCLEEQQKIAAFFSTLDEKIELSERKLEALEQLKKGLMQKLFRQEIRFKKKDGSNFPNWEKIQIKDIGKINTGATPSSSNENIELYGGSYLWVTPTDIKHKEIKSTSKKLTDAGLKLGRVIPENSVLVTCIASIGKNAILREKGSCNQQINSITPFPNFNLDFVYYAISFNEPVLHRYAGQGGMEILNKKDFSELELLMPSIEEQTIIADLLSEVDNKISLSVKQIEMLNILKKGFMQQMLV